ncbi:MAG: hypothetical protein RBQ99_08400, partial [Trichlorobacter sp.]|nr:hypothetical protein [Trichlorobacter sp.]
YMERVLFPSGCVNLRDCLCDVFIYTPPHNPLLSLPEEKTPPFQLYVERVLFPFGDVSKTMD